MAASQYKKRPDWIKNKALGIEEEFSSYLQDKVFQKGRDIEEEARPIIEKEFGIELFPITAETDDGVYSASMDGATMDAQTVWECKQWAEPKAVHARDDRIPPEDFYQVVQQVLVSGCTRHIYTLFKSPNEYVNVITIPDEKFQAEIQKLKDGWALACEELAAYKMPEIITAKEFNAPSLEFHFTGNVIASNFPTFRERIEAYLEGINSTLETDEDFAQAQADVKALTKVEDAIKKAQDDAIAQVPGIYALLNAAGELKKKVAGKRLPLSKDVVNKKEMIRAREIQAGKKEIEDYVAAINRSCAPYKVPRVPLDLPAAIKGRKTLKGVKEAISNEVMKAKLEYACLERTIQSNKKILDQYRGKFHLFPDIDSLIVLEDGFEAILAARVNADFKAAQIESELGGIGRLSPSEAAYAEEGYRVNVTWMVTTTYSGSIIVRGNKEEDTKNNQEILQSKLLSHIDLESEAGVTLKLLSKNKYIRSADVS